MVSERFGSAALFVEPGFELHGYSLDQPKRLGQGLSKPRMFMLRSTMDELATHRKKRLQALIDGKPFLGNQSAFAVKAGLSKGRITQLLDPKESFGERSGMNLALKLGIKDERYFERSDEIASASPRESQAPTTEPAPDAVLGALRTLANSLRAANNSTRKAVAASFSVLASDPDQVEDVIATLEKLLPRPDAARDSQDDQPAGGTTFRLPTGGLKPDEQRVRVQARQGKR
jgi:hypothetical protein